MESHDRLVTEMARAARTIDVSEDLDTTLHSIVTAAVASLPGINHAGVTIAHRDGRLETRACTDDLVARLDQLQYEMGEGPCVYAIDNDPVVLVDRMRHDQRWPRFVPAAVALGVQSQIGLRLYLDERTLGGLNLYSTEVETIDDDVPGLAELFAVHAALALGYVRQREQLHDGLHGRTQIGQAMGILMERHSIDEDTAFSYLRRISSHTNVKLREVAARIIQATLEGTAATPFEPPVEEGSRGTLP